VIIEIRELVIKATVVPTAAPTQLPAAALEQLKKRLIDECVDSVLERLNTADQR
jgi:hypothetical protein